MTRQLRMLAILLGVAVVVAVAIGIRSRGQLAGDALAAHQATVTAERSAAAAETVFVRDTLERRVTVTRYRTLADSARAHLTDTVLVARTLDAGDAAVARSDSSIEQAGRALEARRILEGALRTELAIERRRRPARFQVTAVGTFDLETNIPTAALEGTIRVTDRVQLLARLEQRLTVGERPHRQLGVRVTF